MSEDLSDFFKLISEDKKKKKEDFNEMVGDLGLDSLFNDIAVEKKRIKEEKEKQLAKKVEEEKKQKEKFDKIVGDMSLDSLFGDLAKVKKESKEEKEKEQKILSSFENFLTNKIDDIEEIKDEVVEDVNVVEEVKPEPEEVKSEPEVPSFVEKSLEILDEVSDPLTPLDQNFATLQDLQDHYRKFLVRIQQQLSSLGGGGIEDAPKTGGPYVRQGQKWVVSSGGGGGIGTDGSVNTTGIITASSFSGDGSALTGISGGIGTDGSVNTTGIITASSFSGDGSNLTGIISGVWTTSGSDIYYTTGKVGIGTDDPQQLLHLASTNPRIRLDDTDSGGYYTELRQGGSATYLHLDGDNIGSGNFRITADGGNEIFRFNDKGNVSIAGSTSSFDKNTTVTGLQLYYERDTQLATIASYDGTNGSEISIGTNDGTGDVVEAIRIKSDGNIGIGSDVPKAKLDVNGTVNVTGVSTFSGDVNFDNATLYVDSTNNRIGVGLNNPAVPLHMFGSYPTLKIQNSATAQYASASIDLQGPAGDERYTKILHGNSNTGGTETYFQIEQYDSAGSYVKQIAHYNYENDYWNFLPTGTERLRVNTSGIDVTGHTETDTLNVSGVSTFTSTVEIKPDSDVKALIVDSTSATTTNNPNLTLKGSGPQVIDFRDSANGNGLKIAYRTGPNQLLVENSEDATTHLKIDRDDGRVELSYGGSKKFETTGAGVTVTGILTATSFSGSAANLTGLTGASAATYGSSSVTPIITVDANGRITGISTAAISGGGGGGVSEALAIAYAIAL